MRLLGFQPALFVFWYIPPYVFAIVSTTQKLFMYSQKKHKIWRLCNTLITNVLSATCKTAHFALWNGPFCAMKWAVLQCEMGRFANRFCHGRCEMLLRPGRNVAAGVPWRYHVSWWVAAVRECLNGSSFFAQMPCFVHEWVLRLLRYVKTNGWK